MASSMIVSSAASTAINRATPAQASMVAPFTGLKSAAFPVTRKLNTDLSSLPSNGSRVQCMLLSSMGVAAEYMTDRIMGIHAKVQDKLHASNDKYKGRRRRRRRRRRGREMASSMMLSSAASPVINRPAPAQASMVAPFTGLKSAAAFPVTRKLSTDLSSLPSNGGRVQCMLVWPPVGLKKFETLSYLPPLGLEALAKQVYYLIARGWIPCIEFDRIGFVFRENNRSPGYYDGRYWTMWKLPMYGCTDASQVLNELEECKKGYPQAFIRIIGFDRERQVQCISFIGYKPPGN